MSTLEQIADRLYGAPAATPAPAAAAKPSTPSADSFGRLPPDGRYTELAEKMYPRSPLAGVNFDEPTQSNGMSLANTQPVPRGASDSEQGLATVRDALHGAGFGITQSAELWNLSVDAWREPNRHTVASGMAQLQATYGAAAASKIFDAKRQVESMRAAWPGVDDWINKVGNNPAATIILAERWARRK